MACSSELQHFLQIESSAAGKRGSFSGASGDKQTANKRSRIQEEQQLGSS